MNNYKDNNRKSERGVEHIPADLFKLFDSHEHKSILEDCTITLVDKTDGADPTRREEYLGRVLKTVSSYGLNIVVKKFCILARLLYIFLREECY